MFKNAVSALAAGLAAAALAACSGSSGVASSRATETGVRVDRACPSAPVHYGAVTGGAAENLPQRVPWVAGKSSTIVGFLFYFHAKPFASARLGRAVISTRGTTLNSSTKILWWVRGIGLGHALTIAGDRLDGPGTFREQASTALGTTTHPSIVSIPTAGCWQLRLTSGGISDRVTFQAVWLHP